MVLSNREVLDHLKKDRESCEGFISSFEDSLTFQNHAFFQKHKNAIQILFYFDEFQSNNPLGAKTYANKMGAFYMSILNLPDHLRSFIGNVHLVALAKHADIEKYGFSSILEPFIRDLRKLETDKGITVDVLGEKFTLRASLAGFAGDTLAANAILGFLGPGAIHFCRICKISRDQLYAFTYLENFVRTKEEHDLQLTMISFCQTVTKADELRTDSGIKEHSILNESRFFHCTNNYILDTMHDGLEGQFMYVVKLIIQKLIVDPKYKFDLDTLHFRLSHFNYGVTQNSNKPSSTFTLTSLKDSSDHKLKQSAVQMKCLIKVLPFIISDKVKWDDRIVSLLINVGKIVQILFSPKIEYSVLGILAGLIDDHDQEFREAFPNADIINKLHQIHHDVECIIHSGPLQHYNCFVFEAKHAFFNKIARSHNNYTNLPSTLAKVSQMSQSAIWGCKKEYVREKYLFSFCLDTTFENLDYSEHVTVENETTWLTKNVLKTNMLKIYSTEYNVGSFVVINLGSIGGGEKLPLFGKILEIFLMDNEPYIIYEEWQSTSLCEYLNAYHIEKVLLTPFKLININNLCDPKPLDAWKAYKHPDELFICLDHFIF